MDLLRLLVGLPQPTHPQLKKEEQMSTINANPIPTTPVVVVPPVVVPPAHPAHPVWGILLKILEVVTVIAPIAAAPLTGGSTLVAINAEAGLAGKLEQILENKFGQGPTA